MIGAASGEGVVIDLGLDREPPELRRRPRRSWRREFGVVVACGVLLALAGSATPSAPALRGPTIVHSALADRAIVLMDRVYLVGSGEPERSVSAFSLPTGGPLWRTPFRAEGQLRRLAIAGDSVLLSMYDPLFGRGRVYAFDGRDGRPLWDAEAALVDVVDDGTGLIYRRAEGYPSGTTSEVVAVDARTGRVRWSGVVPSRARFERVGAGNGDGGGAGSGGSGGSGDGGGDGDAARVRWAVTVPEDNAPAQVWDLHTGAIVAQAAVTPDGAELLDLRAAAGVLLARYAMLDGTGQRLAAYAVDTLAPLWAVRAPSIREFYPSACGGLLCVAGDDAITALDPRTGAMAWRAEYEEVTGGGGSLFGLATDGRLAVLAPETGVAVASLPDWRILGPAGADGRIQLVARAVPGANRVFVGLLDPAAAAVRTLGSASGVLAPSCRTGAGSLVCELISGGVGVWTYRVGPRGS
jgi:outer membrane protein assembly factor BamB